MLYLLLTISVFVMLFVQFQGNANSEKLVDSPVNVEASDTPSNQLASRKSPEHH